MRGRLGKMNHRHWSGEREKGKEAFLLSFPSNKPQNQRIGEQGGFSIPGIYRRGAPISNDSERPTTWLGPFTWPGLFTGPFSWRGCLFYFFLKHSIISTYPRLHSVGWVPIFAWVNDGQAFNPHLINGLSLKMNGMHSLMWNTNFLFLFNVLQNPD